MFVRAEKSFDAALLGDDEKRREGEHTISPEELQKLMPLLDWLSPKLKDVFMLLYVARIPQSQIARLLGDSQPVISYRTKCLEKYLNRIQRRFELLPEFQNWLDTESRNYPPDYVGVFVAYFFGGCTGSLAEITGISGGAWLVYAINALMEARQDKQGLAILDEIHKQPLKRGEVMNKSAKRKRRTILKKKIVH